MPRYAIKTVPAEWKDTMPLPFDERTRMSAKIEPGLHVLIYRRGVGIVADGEIQANFIRSDAWLTDQPLPPVLAQAPYLLPVEALYYRGKVVAPEIVRQILGDPNFPPFDAWRPIDAQTYHQFIRRML